MSDPFRLLKFTRRAAAAAGVAATMATMPARAFWEGNRIPPEEINAAAERMRETARKMHLADEDDIIHRLVWEEESRWPIEHWRLLAAAALINPKRS